MQKLLSVAKIIFPFLFICIFFCFTFWYVTNSIFENKEKENQQFIHKNENIVSSNLEFFKNDIKETFCWTQCNYLRGTCDLKICSTKQLITVNCGGYKCWLQ
jgi:hypothetical protein